MATKRKELVDQFFADLSRRQARKRKAMETLEDKARFLAAGYTAAQLAARRDTSKLRSILVPRRGGKSHFVLMEILEKALLTPESDWVVIGLSRPAVKRIYWRVVLRFNEQLMLGAKAQNTEMILTLPNGARIVFVGADNRAEMEKLRGNAFNGAVIDECKSFERRLLQELIYDVLMPALADRRGQLTVIGTPGELLAGPFYEATCFPPIKIPSRTGHKWSNRLSSFRGGPPPESLLPADDAPHIWSLHRWYTEDNTAVPGIWLEMLADKERFGWPDDHPTWRREARAEWVPSTTFRVYRYQPALHDYTPSPNDRFGIPGGNDSRLGDFNLVYGVDLGFRDATGVVVWAYSRHSPEIWCVYAEKRKGLNLREVAEWLKGLYVDLGPDEVTVMDIGSNKGAVLETFAETFGIYAIGAEKPQKKDYIEAFNTDLDAKRLHIPAGSEYGEELLDHVWKMETVGTEKKTESDATANDLADAGLYSYRWIYNHSARPKDLEPLAATREWWDRYQAREMAEAEKAERRSAVTWDDPSYLDMPMETPWN